MNIPPTVGRVVWLYKFVEGQGHKGPLSASVAKVHSDSIVNIGYFHENGIADSQTSVRLIQQGEPIPDADYVTWMPYQVGQAKKHADDKPAV